MKRRLTRHIQHNKELGDICYLIMALSLLVLFLWNIYPAGGLS